MRPSEWVRDRIEAMARHHPLVWVEDPYRLLEDSDVRQLETILTATSHRVAPVESALRLREALDSLEVGPAGARAVIIDQSYTLRDPHLLPKDAKPSPTLPLLQ
jgi:hypothetical protein